MIYPQVQILPGSHGGFNLWCRACGTRGYASEQLIATRWWTKHQECKEQHTAVRR
jgi:hypothetical protein